MTYLISPAAHVPDGEYRGKHRSDERPVPHPHATVGPADVAVVVNLSNSDPFLMIGGEYDDVTIELSGQQRDRIVAAAQPAIEARAIEADLARQDAYFRKATRS